MSTSISEQSSLHTHFETLARRTGHIVPHPNEPPNFAFSKYLEILATYAEQQNRRIEKGFTENEETWDGRYGNLRSEVGQLNEAVMSFDKTLDGALKKIESVQESIDQNRYLQDLQEVSKRNRERNRRVYRANCLIAEVKCLDDLLKPLPKRLENLTVAKFWKLRLPKHGSKLLEICEYYNFPIEAMERDKIEQFDSEGETESDSDDEVGLKTPEFKSPLEILLEDQGYYHQLIADQLGLNYELIESHITILRNKMFIPRKRSREVIQIPVHIQSVPETPRQVLVRGMFSEDENESPTQADPRSHPHVT